MDKFKEEDLENLVMERLSGKSNKPQPDKEMLRKLMDVAVIRNGGIPEIPNFEIKPVEKI